MQHFGVCKKRAVGIAMPWPALLNDKYRQAVRIMKITAFILLVCTLHVSAGGFSQSITLSEKEAPLTKVFKAIEKQTDYIFFYNVEWVKNIAKVNVKVKDMQLQQVLDLLFKNQPITYSITGKMITVFPKKNDAPPGNENQSSTLIDIHGKVVDENGKPVPGVTVAVKGTKKQTITNDVGEFTLSGVDSYALLSFSTVNMEPFEISVRGQTEIVAKLKTKTSQLDEVQVIAYGQTTKRLQTGNVSSVKSEEIGKQPVSNPLLALEGRIPGLVITQNNGLPGAAVKVRIQGQNSLAKGNDPLYVIDGVPFTSQLPVGIGRVLGTGNVLNATPSYGNPLNYINPADIESIDVLKDADATAIYGSRAANGAILITTKKGKAGKNIADINLQQGWGKVTRKVDMLNSSQYLEVRREALNNDGIIPSLSNGDYDLLQWDTWDTTRYTDWQKELIGGIARYQNIQTNFSGGNDRIQYLIGGNYHKETTVFPGDFSDEKAALHFNINSISSNQKFTLQLTGNYMADNNKLMYQDITSYALSLSPIAPPLYLPDGSLNYAPKESGSKTFDNPIAYLYNKYKNKTTNLIGNAKLSYELFKGLKLATSLGYSSLATYEVTIFPLIAIAPNLRPSRARGAQYANNSTSSYIVEPQLSYKKNIFKGKLEVLLGSTIQQNKIDGQILSGTGYNSDLVLEDSKSATTVSVASTIASNYKYNAVFGRINYNWNEKYLVSLNARRDGSSRFGPQNRFHNFASSAIGWVFSQENFIKRHLQFLSFGKLRASYGTTGNDQIGDYQFLNLYSPNDINLPYQSSRGLSANGLQNEYLQWEQTRKFQVGIDVGVLNDKLLLSAGYFNNRSSKQLLDYVLPILTGFTTITMNFPATVQNTGWELTFSTNNIKNRNFSWSSSINLTIPKNKLVSFPDLAKSSYADYYVVGQPITLVKAYRSLNVDPATGKYQFVDSSGNPTFSPSFSRDRTVLINTSPKFYGGFQNTFRYKNIQLDFLLQFVKQVGYNELEIGNGYPGYFSAGNYNQPVSVLDRWKKPGDIKGIQRYNQDFSIYSQYSYAQSSDIMYVNASYLRLRNTSMSWSLPQNLLSRLHLQTLRLYVQGQNLLTITSYKGLDPETLSSRSLPPLRVWVLGLQVGL